MATRYSHEEFFIELNICYTLLWENTRGNLKNDLINIRSPQIFRSIFKSVQLKLLYKISASCSASGATFNSCNYCSIESLITAHENEIEFIYTIIFSFRNKSFFSISLSFSFQLLVFFQTW